MVDGNAGVISEGERPVAAVVNTNEEWMIARDTAELAGLAEAAITRPGQEDSGGLERDPDRSEQNHSPKGLP